MADDFLNFIKNKKLIIHNAEFDLGHLNNELKIAGKDRINENEVVDTLELARDKFPGSAINLDALCKRFRVDNSKRVNHTALIDCELLSKVYINLIDQREPTLNLYSQNKEIKDLKIDNNNLYYKKVIKPSSQEIELHKKFLKKSLKKNFFN